MTQKKARSATPPQYGFSIASTAYEQNGFKPVPLAGKNLLVKGATGHDGTVTAQQVEDWREMYPNANTGIVAHGWVSIDVDHHDEKYGADSLVELERRHGKLPRTWKSSARGADSPSAQYFYRVEDIVPYASNPAKHIEIIHPTHRYAAVAPSIHPELGTEYVWYDPSGSPASQLPDIDELPELPLTWTLAFSRPENMDLTGTKAFSGNNQIWIDWLDDSGPTFFTLQLIEEVESLNHIGHNALLILLGRVRDLEIKLWERGTRKAFEAISTKFFATTNNPQPDIEFNNLLNWVIGEDWQLTAKSFRTAREIMLHLIKNFEASDDKKFWTSRESLRSIYSLGRKKVISPYTLLGMTMLRALNTVPWNVYYRSFRGTVSLNSLVAFVGPTGTGKSLTLDATSSYIVFSDSPVRMGGDGTWKSVVEPGSGEAIPDHYMTWQKDENGARGLDWGHPNRAAIFAFDEIGMLEARQGREGSTIIEYAKQGWSGSVLGRELASGKGVMLDAKSYRFALFANVQPARAGLLFTAAAISGGLPSRFLFFNTQDPLGKKEFDPTPASVIRLPPVNWGGSKYIDALPVMDEAHKEESFKAIDGGIPELDSHLLLTRAKVAVALAVLDGRSTLVDEDWDLSQYVISHSKATRDVILRELVGAQGAEIAKQGKAAGMKASIASEVEANRMVKKVAERIKSMRAEGVSETGEHSIKKRLRNDQRKYYGDAVEYLDSGQSSSIKAEI
jgi:hypothetical protein